MFQKQRHILCLALWIFGVHVAIPTFKVTIRCESHNTTKIIITYYIGAAGNGEEVLEGRLSNSYIFLLRP